VAIRSRLTLCCAASRCRLNPYYHNPESFQLTVGTHLPSQTNRVPIPISMDLLRSLNGTQVLELTNTTRHFQITYHGGTMMPRADLVVCLAGHSSIQDPSLLLQSVPCMPHSHGTSMDMSMGCRGEGIILIGQHKGHHRQQISNKVEDPYPPPLCHQDSGPKWKI
jgi:hypothetical protein